MAVFFTSYPAAALICIGATVACADDFAKQCGELPQQVKIAVTFQDRAVVIDESRDVQALNGMFGKRAGGQHNVYGLTHADPNFRVGVVPRAVVNGRGQICAMPDISLVLGFSEIVVYLARELVDSCRRNIIREHEDEHVNTWKAQLRASAQLLTTILIRDVGEPRIYASRDEAEAGIRTWADELVTPWAKRIIETVREAQGAIDTPTSYAAVVGRIRNCPPSRR